MPLVGRTRCGYTLSGGRYGIGKQHVHKEATMRPIQLLCLLLAPPLLLAGCRKEPPKADTQLHEAVIAGNTP